MKREEALTECAMSVKPELWGYNRQMDHREHSFGWNEYMLRRTELINEPDDADTPEWARWKAQDSAGEWFWYSDKPSIRGRYWQHYRGYACNETAGKVPAGHRWQYTLKEVSSLNRELNPPASSLTDSQAREMAGQLGRCSDGLACGVPPNSGDDDYCADCPNAPHAQDARRLDEQLQSDIAAASKHYRHSYKGVKLDPYRIASVYDMNGGPREQILKKVLRFTDKGHTEQQVVNEIRSALDRWQEMLDEDAAT